MKKHVILFLKGMAMGAADVVPGVSGGTIAFISGIYEDLIDALRSLTPAALIVWRREGFASFWRHIHGSFLLVLFSGVLLSILSLAKTVVYCLEHYPLLVWGFFFGLVLASSIYIGRQLPFRSKGVWVAIVIGLVIALWISVARPVQMPGEWWMAFIAGSLAICAMLLPGISGSFVLLLMGMYSFILHSLLQFNLTIIGSFVAGCILGLTLFSHVLGWLLQHYRTLTMATATGFLLGSLNLIWPWRQTVESYIDRHGEEVPLRQANLLPGDFAQQVGDPQTLAVLGLIIFGLALVLILESAATWGKKPVLEQRI